MLFLFFYEVIRLFLQKSSPNPQPYNGNVNALFKDNDSLVSKIDPRARIVGTVIFAFSVVLSDGLLALCLALLCSFTMACCAKLKLVGTLKKMAAMDAFMLYLILILPFSVPGDSFITLFGFEGSWQGLFKGLIITLKANAVVLMIFAGVSILPANVLGSALTSLKVSHKLIQLLLFTMRYLKVIGDEFQRLRRAMRARAFVLRFNWHSWKSIGYLIGMMIVRSMHRSERVVAAMKCRGYQGQFVSYHPLSWQVMDFWYCVLMSLGCSAIITLNFVGGL